MEVTLLARADSSAAWSTSTSPILLDGEFGFDKTTHQLKMGDGTTTWAELPWVTLTPEQTAQVIELLENLTNLDDVRMAEVLVTDDSDFVEGLAGIIGAGDGPIGVALDARFPRLWKASTAYTTGTPVTAPDGSTIVRNSNGTSRATFDSTERALWTGVAGVAGTIAQLLAAASTAPAGDTPAIWYLDNQTGADDDAKFAAALTKWNTAARGGKIVLSARPHTFANQWSIPNNGASIPAQNALIIEGQGASHNSAGGGVNGGTIVDHTYNSATAVAKLDSRGSGLLILRDFTWRDISTIVRAVTNKALTSNVATLTIGTHTVVAGQSVVVAGVDATFNGTVTVTGVTSTTISYAKTASDVSSVAASGTVTGGDHTPFYQVTNTTTIVERLMFWGEKSQENANQDCISLGGGTRDVDGTPTAKFNGYKPIVRDCHFHRIRRAVWLRPGCNDGLISGNTVWTDCGAQSDQYGAIDLIGSVTGSIVGNVITDNTLETSHYANIILVGSYTQGNIFRHNGMYDNTATTVCGIRFADNANHNLVEAGYYDGTFPYIRESIASAGTNTFRTVALSRTSVYVQPQLFTGPMATRRLAGVGVNVLATNGDRGYMRVTGGSAAASSYPEAIITTSNALLVADLVTTSGSNVVTSATAAFTAEHKGMPVAATGIPNNTYILNYISATTVELSANCTATAVGVTAQIGRSPANTGGTAVDEIGFARRHINTKGAVGTASKGSAAGGSGSTVAAAGTDTAFIIDLTTASSGTGTGTLCTVAFGIAFTSSKAVPMVTPMNAAAAHAMATNEIYATVTNANFTLAAGAGTPAVSTQMLFAVYVIQS